MIPGFDQTPGLSYLEAKFKEKTFAAFNYARDNLRKNDRDQLNRERKARLDQGIGVLTPKELESLAKRKAAKAKKLGVRVEDLDSDAEDVRVRGADPAPAIPEGATAEQSSGAESDASDFEAPPVKKKKGSKPLPVTSTPVR